MSMIVRSSKFRHVYADQPKPKDCIIGLRLSSATGDQNYIQCNGKYYAYAVPSGGGALTVQSLNKVGKLDPCLKVIDGHSGSVLDFDFDPFHSDLITTGGDDCMVKLWQIPEGGLIKENLVNPLVDMKGHQKKISVVKYNPVANAVLATGSADCTVKIWDTTRGDCKVNFTESKQLIQDIAWNYNGSQLAVSAKDKKMHVVDPRTGASIASVQAHDGSKTSKLTWLGSSDKLCSVGFTKTSKRQFKIWDPRNLADGPITTRDIDQASGAMIPFFDEDTKLLYIAGKGDCNIRYYEISDKAPYQYHISDFRGKLPMKGLALLPKRYCDSSKCEVNRMVKLTKDSIEPLSFIVPRKSDIFQEDLYPDCYAGKASITSDEFFEGKNGKPILMSMNPCIRNEQEEQKEEPTTFVVQKSALELEKELKNMKSYIKILKNCLDENNIKYPMDSESSALTA